MMNKDNQAVFPHKDKHDNYIHDIMLFLKTNNTFFAILLVYFEIVSILAGKQ